MENILDVLSGKIKLSENNVKTDSRNVGKGDVFIAVTGPVNDGHAYIPEVLGKGASWVVCEHAPKSLSNEDLEKIIIVKDSREALGTLMKHIFRDPSSRMKVYGVTGTNGKTTTVFLIETVLREAGIGCGMISTVFNKTADGVLNASTMTTPGATDLYKLLGSLADSGKKAAVVEISSHAIHQKRIWGIGLDTAVFTNISPEHLDYHKNMGRYLADKSRIFENLKSGGLAVVNCDDIMVATLPAALKLKNVLKFGIENDPDVTARDISMTDVGTEFDLVIKGKKIFRAKTKLVGLHNVYNMLAAASALYGTGIASGFIKRGFEAAQPVPGRLDPVASSAPFRVFVDYAHTPDALEKVLKYLRPVTEGKLICVFGCGGDRDRTKRPEMGRVACDICDRVILTSDNPRSEDPLSILKEIEKGVLEKHNYSIISERKKAIQEALQNAGNGDVVLIAGKGHENYQIIGDRKFHFDDKETASELLKSRGY